MGMFEKYFKPKENITKTTNEKGTDTIDDKKIEKALQKVTQEGSQIKKVYDSWANKYDNKGNSMQTKFLEFIANHPRDEVVYNKLNEEFEIKQFRA